MIPLQHEELDSIVTLISLNEIMQLCIMPTKSPQKCSYSPFKAKA